MVFLLIVVSPKQNKFVILKLIVEVPLVSFSTRDISNGSERVDNNHGFQKKFEDSDYGKGQFKNMDSKNKRAKDMIQKYV